MIRPLRHLEPSLYMHQSDQSLSWTSEVSVRFSEINLIAAICLARAEAEHTEIASKRRRRDHPLGAMRSASAGPATRRPQTLILAEASPRPGMRG